MTYLSREREREVKMLQNRRRRARIAAEEQRHKYFSEADRLRIERAKKAKKPPAETRDGVDWAHFSSSRSSGTKAVVTGHGFAWRYCADCNDVRLWHITRGCSSAHRHG